MAIDLHCHTHLSDGSLGIEELLTVAKRRGISAVAVTDHDTTASAARAVVIGRRQGIHVIHGIELTSTDTARGTEAHLLCYLCDKPDRLEGLCRRTNDQRRQAMTAAVRKVMRYFPITPEIITRIASGSIAVFEQHVMHALIDAGYADTIYGDVYEKLFGENGSAYTRPTYTDTKEVLDLIHSAGGVAVLAHPTENEALLEELTALGLDGVEAYLPEHTPEQTERLVSFAKENGLLTTGGTDFHGMYARKPRPMGSVAVPEECLEMLTEYKAQKRKAVS